MKILLPTDGSEYSEEAAKFLKKLMVQVYTECCKMLSPYQQNRGLQHYNNSM